MTRAFTLILLLCTFGLTAQNNATDSQGKKHGVWVKYYEGKAKKIKYKGQFEHGVPVGTFVYFHANGAKQAENVFKGKTGNCYSKQFSEKRQLEAEGWYINQQKDSIWTYYGLEGQLLSREGYKLGKLDGDVLVYYADGKLAEKTQYIDGVKEGLWVQKYPDGKTKFKGTHKDGHLQGEAVYFSQDGRPSYKGSYLKGLRHGKWFCTTITATPRPIAVSIFFDTAMKVHIPRK